MGRWGAIAAATVLASVMWSAAAQAGTVAFVAVDPRCSAPMDECPGGLFTTSDRGGAVRKVSTDSVFFPRWSPGGRALVYVKELDPMTRPEITTVGAAGVGEHAVTPRGHPVTGGGNPVWSADGRRLIFVSAVQNDPGDTEFFKDSDIYSMRLDGSGVRQLTNGRDNESNPFVGPDGRIYFSRSRLRGFDYFQSKTIEDAEAFNAQSGLGVHSVAPGGGDERQLTFGTAPTSEARMSPDGRWLAFGALDYGILVMNLQTGAVKRVPGWLNRYSAWADNDRLLFTTRDPAPSDRSPWSGAGYIASFDVGREGAGLQRVLGPYRALDGVDWHPGTGILPDVVPDLTPPVVGLLEDRRRDAGASAATRGGVSAVATSRSIRIKNLRFLAADATGIKRVEVSAFRKIGRRCRFLVGGRLSARRPCSDPVYRDLRGVQGWPSLMAHLRPGTWGFRFRTTDTRGRRGTPTRTRYLRLKR